MNIEQSAIVCQQEHQAYHQKNEFSAPVSIQIFRLAFAGNLQAWACLYKVFQSQIEKWIGLQSWIDPEVVMQEAWLSFARYAPKSQTLITTDNLGPILAYLRRCVKTTLVDQARLLKKGPPHVISLEDARATAAPDDVADRAMSAVLLQERKFYSSTYGLGVICHRGKFWHSMQIVLKAVVK